MKTVLTLIAMTLGSFSSVSSRQPVNAKASQELAEQVIAALRNSSDQSYGLLLPSLQDFNKIMKDNKSIYGGNLEAAQLEFEQHYKNILVPTTENSFRHLLSEGRRRGIDWQKISLMSWETEASLDEHLQPATFVIAIEADDKIYRIEIDKAIYLKGQWKVSQFIRLV